MCGIAGGVTLKVAHELYLNNLDRGYFSSGCLVVTESRFIVLKQKEVFDINIVRDSVKEQTNEEPIYYLFHSRAPTNTGETEWNIDTTHPFSYKNWFVAQNGIITNFNTFTDAKDFKVDSSIVPYHIFENKGNIGKTYEAYQGLLTSWIYNTSTNKIYVVKAGSSLYMNADSFSSNSHDKLQRITPDGKVYMYNGTHFEEHCDFTYNNPYFII
jgi:predicted glutamine amidotransferase